ncbi:M23 family metallopeptidase [Virgibacillus alimentarius]|uniref:M23 family metallopeptidase n=1 Tax=Virgibacillus alimentarius TaxID=698769 RepID=UPI000B0798B7|nr:MULTISPECIES: M23 family metallopeptidase [Virgibacillus]
MMNKKIKKIRQSIEKRKKMRNVSANANEDLNKYLFTTLPQDEERHGNFSTFPDAAFSSKDSRKVASGLILKSFLSVMLFFGVALLLQTDKEILDKPKGWTSNALTEEFPFARVNLWYQETFGSPLTFSPKSTEATEGEPSMALPVSGSVTESFQANGTGVMITPSETDTVNAFQDGVVVFAGNDRETDKTVIVQHADGSESTYGHLSSIEVHPYQFITADQKLGKFKPSDHNKTVYFSIEKDKEYIDPVQVIKVDDNF